MINSEIYLDGRRWTPKSQTDRPMTEQTFDLKELDPEGFEIRGVHEVTVTMGEVFEAQLKVKAPDHSKVVCTPSKIDLTDVEEVEESTLKLVLSRNLTTLKELRAINCFQVDMYGIERPEMEVDLSGGGVKIDHANVKELTIRSSSSDVRLRSITAGNADIRSISGTVLLVKSKFEECAVNSTSGDVTLDEVTATAVDAQTVSGDISLITVTAERPFDLTTVSGEITLKKVTCSSGGRCKASTTSGDVGVNDSNIQLRVSTVSGDLRGRGDSTKVRFESVSGQNRYGSAW